MKSEAEVMKKLESRYRLFAKTGNEKFMAQACVLEEILELKADEVEKMFNKAIERE